MSDIKGLTFAEQAVTPAADAVIRNVLIHDCILTGCNITFSGATLTVLPGYIMAAGRQIYLPAAKSVAVSGAASGYARAVLTIDLSKAATASSFEQVSLDVQYASALGGFASLQQEDINSAGTIYQAELCTVALATTGITQIISMLRPYTIIIPEHQYGTQLPASGAEGMIFFLLEDA